MCGALSLLGLVVWYMTRVGNVAIIFSILADGLAALPTIVKSYNYPETENRWGYLTAAISAVLALLTIKIWNFAHWGFLLYILIVNLVIFMLIQFKMGKKF